MDVAKRTAEPKTDDQKHRKKARTESTESEEDDDLFEDDQFQGKEAYRQEVALALQTISRVTKVLEDVESEVYECVLIPMKLTEQFTDIKEAMWALAETKTEQVENAMARVKAQGQ